MRAVSVGLAASLHLGGKALRPVVLLEIVEEHAVDESGVVCLDAGVDALVPVVVLDPLDGEHGTPCFGRLDLAQEALRGLADRDVVAGDDFDVRTAVPDFRDFVAGRLFSCRLARTTAVSFLDLAEGLVGRRTRARFRTPSRESGEPRSTGSDQQRTDNRAHGNSPFLQRELFLTQRAQVVKVSAGAPF